MGGVVSVHLLQDRLVEAEAVDAPAALCWDFGEGEVALSPELTGRLRSFADENNLTLNTLLQGAWALLLSRYRDCEEVLFGVRTTTSGAAPHERSLPLRVSVAPDTSLLPWLRDLRDRCRLHARFG